MSIILHSDGLIGKMTGTVYGEQVTISTRFLICTQWLLIENEITVSLGYPCLHQLNAHFFNPG